MGKDAGDPGPGLPLDDPPQAVRPATRAWEKSRDQGENMSPIPLSLICSLKAVLNITWI